MAIAAPTPQAAYDEFTRLKDAARAEFANGGDKPPTPQGCVGAASLAVRAGRDAVLDRAVADLRSGRRRVDD